MKSHSSFTVSCQKLIFGRMTEEQRGHNSFLCKMTSVKVKVTIKGHKGQILGQNLDLSYFPHLQLLEQSVIRIENLLG